MLTVKRTISDNLCEQLVAFLSRTVVRPCIGVKDRLQLVDLLEEPTGRACAPNRPAAVERRLNTECRVANKEEKNKDASYTKVRCFPLKNSA